MVDEDMHRFQQREEEVKRESRLIDAHVAPSDTESLDFPDEAVRSRQHRSIDAHGTTPGYAAQELGCTESRDSSFLRPQAMPDQDVEREE